MVPALLAILVVLPSIQAVKLNGFFPFGTSQLDNIVEPGDDISSMRIDLDVPIVFYNLSYNSLYVNTNGHVSFVSQVPDYRPDSILPLGLDSPLIAVFLADVDTTRTGRIYYRWTDQEDVLQRTAYDIRQHFSGFESYMPSLLFIATWENVGFYNAKSDKLNTFQLVLVTDGRNSFALFHYLDNGIDWMQSEGKLAPLLDPMPQAGFDGGRYGLSYLLDGSGETGRFITGSNIDVAGAWMFQIGDVGNQNVRSTDLQTGVVTVFEVETSQGNCYPDAMDGRCHAQAQCVDNRDTFCCQCVAPFIGNGLYCVGPDQARHRLGGPLTGRVNGIPFPSRARLETTVLGDTGRSYTSMMNIPSSFSTALSTVTFLGGVSGWLFAPKRNTNNKNGFQVVGSKFNITNQISFLKHNGEEHILRTHQTFQGHNSNGKVDLETHIEGELPDVPYNASTRFEVYRQTFRKIAPGTMKSSVNRVYRVDNIAYRYRWESTVMYEECGAESSRDLGNVMTVLVDRLYAHILGTRREDMDTSRFATQSSIVATSGFDPCAEASCHSKAECVPLGETFSCTCQAGYTGDGTRSCEDINECEDNPCGTNSRCRNVMGAFQCLCHPGYVRDGNDCRAQTCKDANICSDNAECVFDPYLQSYQCECLDEFSGDGYTCEATVAGFSSCDACDRYAFCTTDESTNRKFCECRPGYTGDGTTCTLIENCRSCHGWATCEFVESLGDYSCVCRRGYQGDGQTCEKQDCREDVSLCDPQGGVCWLDRARNFSFCRCSYGYQGDGFDCQPMDCSVRNYCDTRGGECAFDGEMHRCKCKEGYEGDGYRCRINRPSQQQACDQCDVNARCQTNAESGYRCICNPGYEGDGRRCRQADVPCNQVNNCDSNAQCIYNPDYQSYTCICNRGFEGDGKYCRTREVIDCRRDPRMCSQYAECIRGRDDTYECACKSGYRGDGKRCDRIIIEGNSLIYAQGNKIMRVNADERSGDNGQIVAYEPGMLAVGVEIDCKEGDIYWTDAAKGVIKKSKFNGGEMQNVLNGMKSPEGIAIDFVARNMFFTDSEMDSLMVAKLNGSELKTLVNTEMANPRAIVLDISRGVIYWTDWNRNLPQIERVNMDGTERNVLINSDIALPNGLAFDAYSQNLCWGDAGTKRIECVRSDGSGRRVVYENAMYPFDIAMLNNVIYWTDWRMREIPNVNQNGGGQNKPLKQVMGGNGRAYGITAIMDRCPRFRNACELNNGGCKYLCLPTERNGRTCECPDGMDPRICQL